MHRHRLVGFLALAAIAVTGAIDSRAQQPAAKLHTLDDLSWIAGDWQTPPGGTRQTDEHWSLPLGGAMLGMSRTVADGKMVEFEYLRIVAREDGIFYVAHPNARSPATEFKLTALTADRAVFENPAHDFPKRIVYTKNADGSLTAKVDAGEGTRGPTFQYRRLGE